MEVTMRSQQAAQATVEFALVAALALAIVLSFIQAGFSSVQTMNAVNVTDTAARIASSAAGSNTSEQTALQTVDTVIPRLKSALFGGTQVIFEPNTWCPSLPKPDYGTVYLCDQQPTTGTCAGMTSVQVWGLPAMLVPLIEFMSPLDPPIHVRACVYDSVFKR
jgi:hypothetical protein